MLSGGGGRDHTIVYRTWLQVGSEYNRQVYCYGGVVKDLAYREWQQGTYNNMLAGMLFGSVVEEEVNSN